MENMILENGRLINDGFFDNKIPRISDIPSITTLLIEIDDPDGPFGAKGIGEAGINSTAPVVVNAIYNACVIRIQKLSILPEEILEGLSNSASKH